MLHVVARTERIGHSVPLPNLTFLLGLRLEYASLTD